MKTVTTTVPMEYIYLNGILYKATSLNNIQQDFKNYVENLDTEIYNLSLENFAKTFNLKYFSDLLETDNLNEEGIEKLTQYIQIYKSCVKETIQKRISQLCEMLNGENA